MEREADMDSVEVSSADIARLAGVRPTAVSNWRRRHDDFPAPIGGTEKSPRFSLDEVLAWLSQQGKTVEVGSQREFEQAVSAAAATTPLAETLRNALFALLDHASDTKTDERGWRERLEVSADRLAAKHPGLPGAAEIGTVDAAQATMLNAAIEAAAGLPVADLAVELYDQIVDRRLGKGDTATPSELAKLMVALADPGGGPLCDLACGAGSILVAAAERGCREVLGMEINPARAQLAALRLDSGGPESPVRSQLTNDGALGSDPFGAASAAAVATYPPFNDRNWAQGIPEDEPWWHYGIPSGRESELAWLQRALFQLRPDGTAVLVMPPAAAARPSGRRIRRRLLSDGVIHAVFALPRGSLYGTALAPHLWLLRPVSGTSATHSALMADFSAHVTDNQRPDWDRIEADAVAAWSAYRRGETASRDDTTVVSAMELLEGNVDLTPGRYLPLRFGDADLHEPERRRSETTALLDRLADRIAGLPGELPGLKDSVRWATIETLEQNDEVSLHRGLPVLREPRPGAEAIRVVRAHRAADEEFADVEPGQHVPRVRAGDLLASVIGERVSVRQTTEDDLDAAPAWGTVIIRTDPRRIDPAFLAGFLAGTLAEQQLSRASSSLGVNSIRDLRRIRVALPGIDDQRRYAGLFTALADIAADSSSLARRAEALTRGWRDSAWAVIAARTDPAA